jgi:hypothetical protein
VKGARAEESGAAHASTAPEIEDRDDDAGGLGGQINAVITKALRAAGLMKP